jgi:hypothetical protein
MEAQQQAVLIRIAEHVAERLQAGFSREQVAMELSERGMPVGLATQLVAAAHQAYKRAATESGRQYRRAFRAECGSTILQVGGRGLGFIALGGFLTLLTIALPLPVFVAFTGLAVSGLIDVLRAIGLCYRWVTVQ